MRWLQNSDLADALRAHELWLYLAWQDIRLRYRRSRIGPFWITLTMAIFVLTLGALYSRLFNADIDSYLPYLSVGMVIWRYISGMLNEFPDVFVSNAAYITGVKINPLTILLRLVTQHLIIFAHNAIIIVGVCLYFGIQPGWTALLALPGFVLITLNLLAIGVSLSLIGARFVDVSPITESVVQIFFFITPIMWPARLVPADSWIMLANPFAHLLNISRSPLLGEVPPFESWFVAVFTLLSCSVMAFFLYRAKVSKIPYWV